MDTDDDTWTIEDADYRNLRPYYRLDGVLHDPDGHPVCTWCIQPIDEVWAEGQHGRYHEKCWIRHVYQPKGKLSW